MLLLYFAPAEDYEIVHPPNAPYNSSIEVPAMKKLVLGVLVLFPLTAGPAMAGGFIKSCSNTALQGTVLVAKCKTAAGALVDAKLELNGNLQVSGSTMMLMQGAFTFEQSQCTGLALSGSILTATCRDKPIKYDLNNSVGNFNGVMKFQ
jgi:hypothetical protein